MSAHFMKIHVHFLTYFYKIVNESTLYCCLLQILNVLNFLVVMTTTQGKKLSNKMYSSNSET